MKKAMHYWGFPKDTSIEEKFLLAKSFGFDGIEFVIMSDDAVKIDSKISDLAQIKHISQNTGVAINSLTSPLNWEASLTSDNHTIRQKAYDLLVRQIDLAQSLEVSAILAIPGFVSFEYSVGGLHPHYSLGSACSYDPSSEVIRYDKAYERALSAFCRISGYAESAGVVVCVENTWSKFLLSPLEMRNFIDSIGSDYVKVYFDVANVMPFGIPEHWIEILGHRIKRVHLKDYKDDRLSLDNFVELGKGIINFERIFNSLTAIGYDGWITCELNDNPSDRCHVLKESSRFLNRFIRKEE